VSVITTRIIEALLYPPAGPLLLIALGILLLRRRPASSTVLLTAGWLALYLVSTPFVASALMSRLESPTPLDLAEIPAGQGAAIVLLAGPDGYCSAPEYGGHTAGPHGLERLRYAARLQRATGLPLLAVGGDALGLGVKGADVLEQVLRDDFRVETSWKDGRSENTVDNARYAREVLATRGIETVYLVTHAWHMPRARRSFEDQGLRVVPAPTGYTTEEPTTSGLFAWVPRASALWQTNWALHEFAG